MNTPSYRSYPIQSQLQGWTRVDMLIALYDRAIVSISSLAEAKQHGTSHAYVEKFLIAQKCLLAIHAGLKPDEDEVAYNIARLIHFVAGELIENRFENAVSTLETIRNGFEAIREEATQLEFAGQIPPLELSQGFNEVV